MNNIVAILEKQIKDTVKNKTVFSLLCFLY